MGVRENSLRVKEHGQNTESRKKHHIWICQQSGDPAGELYPADGFYLCAGKDALGVNGVYTDVLSVLSLTELGIGTALNYSLYKPVAERDIEKIKSYMRFYKKAYLTIAGVIAVLGIAISPF